MRILQFPLARITFGFIFGIVLAYYFKLKPETACIFLFITATFFLIAYYFSKQKKTNTLYFGITTYLLSCSIGIITLIAHTHYFQKDNYTRHPSLFEKQHLVTIVIREKLRNSSSNERYVAIVKQIDNKPQTGRILVNIRTNNTNKPLTTGTILQIRGILSKNNPPKNPYQFDYSNYLDNKQIYAQIYCDWNNIKIGFQKVKDIWYYSSRLKTIIIRNLEKNNFQKAELNVAIALIMGQQQDIDPEIIRDYQYAGAVHILSVSGLHIGFILLFVTFLLRPIPNTKRGSLLKLLLLLVSLFLFGILAGLAPSVVRSVAMFSFVAIADHLRRSKNSYHTLLVSILLILIFQPFFLFDVGFQLSYIALFFILWLQPLLSSIWMPKNKIATYLWDILTVSLAAQIGTLPLSIYYFHQFPGLFFVTNLLIIPALTLIMAVGALVMLLAAFDIGFVILNKILQYTIFGMNTIINTIASLEQFIIRDISLNTSFLISSYLFILAVIVWFKKPNYNKFVLLLFTIIVVQITFITNLWQLENKQEWIVLNSKKNTLIVTRNGKKVTLFANDSLLKTAHKNPILTSYLTGSFSKIYSKKRIQNLNYFNQKKIMILDSSGVYPQNTKPDILLLTQNPKLNIERLLQILKPKTVIADASNYKSNLIYWQATCTKQKIPFHATGEKGYYKLN